MLVAKSHTRVCKRGTKILRKGGCHEPELQSVPVRVYQAEEQAQAGPTWHGAASFQLQPIEATRDARVEHAGKEIHAKDISGAREKA